MAEVGRQGELSFSPFSLSLPSALCPLPPALTITKSEKDPENFALLRHIALNLQSLRKDCRNGYSKQASSSRLG